MSIVQSTVPRNNYYCKLPYSYCVPSCAVTLKGSAHFRFPNKQEIANCVRQCNIFEVYTEKLRLFFQILLGEGSLSARCHHLVYKSVFSVQRVVWIAMIVNLGKLDRIAYIIQA